MNAEFRRLGAFRGVLVVVVAAIAAVAGLASSGLSVAADDHAVATVRPEVPTTVATVAAAPTARRAATRRRARTAAGRPRRKHCRPVAGLEFTVSIGQRCPKPLKHAGSGPHLSAKLRRAASRPRPALGAPAKQPSSTTTTKSPPATTTTTTTAKPSTPPAVDDTGGTPGPTTTPQPQSSGH